MTIFYRSSPFEGTRLRDVQGHHMHEKEESLMPQDLRSEFLVEDMFRFLCGRREHVGDLEVLETLVLGKVEEEGRGYIILLL